MTKEPRNVSPDHRYHQIPDPKHKNIYIGKCRKNQSNRPEYIDLGIKSHFTSRRVHTNCAEKSCCNNKHTTPD